LLLPVVILRAAQVILFSFICFLLQALPTGPMAVEWMHEQSRPPVWEIHLESGWKELPPDAHMQLEECYRLQLPTTVLKAGIYGEQLYRVDMERCVACFDDPSGYVVERRLRRASKVF